MQPPDIAILHNFDFLLRVDAGVKQNILQNPVAKPRDALLGGKQCLGAHAWLNAANKPAKIRLIEGIVIGAWRLPVIFRYIRKRDAVHTAPHLHRAAHMRIVFKFQQQLMLLWQLFARRVIFYWCAN